MENSYGRRLDVLLRHLSSTARSFTSETFNACSNPASAAGDPVVIGAMVLDIHARPSANQLLPGTTTPGRVHYVKGGVGRNVAECMWKQGLSPFFISVVGQDMAGDLLLAHWQSMGLRTDGISRITEINTPVVSAVFDEKGELAGAVADVYAFEKHLTPAWISQFQKQISHASLIMLDANLSEAALQAACQLAKEAKVPVWFEPVSVSKSVRHSVISSHLMFVSPNEAELVAMATGADVKPENTIEHLKAYNDVQQVISLLQLHIIRLLDKGIKIVVLTLGGLGVVLCSKFCMLNDVSLAELSGERIMADAQVTARSICFVHFPALPASVVSLSGAGDCFVAGALAALCTCQGLYASMAFGIAVARHAVQSELNVPSNLSKVQLAAEAQKVLSCARHLHAN